MSTRRSTRNKPADTTETLAIVQETNIRKRVSSKFDSESSDSDNEPLKKPQLNTSKNRKRAANSSDGSSSDSSVGDYLKNPDDIDLGSSFFQRIDKSEKPPDFDSIEKNIFSGIQNTVSDSDESEDELLNKEKIAQEEPTAVEDRMNFTQLHEYNRKLAEAKACVQNYENKATKPEKKINITQLLSAGEKSSEVLGSVESEAETDDEMDWQEIEDKPAETIKIPKEGVQITLAMPVAIKKKKGVDLMAIIKRRINRVKKENQVYSHKVHLLCWIAHGNFVNGILNDENLLGSALSLIPSEKCYPPKHADISYLEQIVKWYGNMMKLQINVGDVKKSPGVQSLQDQMSKKIALSKRDFVFIFIIILRSLGLQCRLVLSLQTVPIRPLNSELCSLSTKDTAQKPIKNDETGPSKSKSNKKLNTSKTSSKLNKSKTSIVKTKTKTTAKNNKTSVTKILTDNKNNAISKVDLSKFIAQSLKDKKLNDVSNTIKNKVVPLKIKNDDKSKRTSSVNKKIEHKDQGSSEVKNEIKRVSSSRNKKTVDTKKTSVSKKISGIQNEECSDIKKKTSRISRSTAKTDSIASQKTTNIVPKIDIKSNSTKAKTSTSTGITKKTSLNPSTSTKNLDTNNTTTDKKPRKTSTNKTPSENKSEGKITRASTGSVKKKTSLDPSTSTKTLDTNNTTTDKKPRRTNTNKASSEIKTEEKITRASTRSVKKEVAPTEDKTRATKRKIIKNLTISQVDGADDEPSTSKQNIFKIKKPTTSSNTCISKHHPRKVKTEKSLPDYDSESDFKSSSSSKLPSKRKDINDNKHNTIKNSTPRAKMKLDVRNDIISLIKGSMTEQRHIEKRKSWKSEESDYDSEYEPIPVIKKQRSIKKTSSEDDFKIKINTKVKQRVKPRSQLDNRVLSTDSEGSNTDKKKKGNDVWMEVFLEAEEKWISVDVIKGQVHCISELHSRASHPISYILAWNNNFSIKDVTARYCPNWNTVTRKLRIDANWWHATLKPYIGIKTSRDKEEDEDLARQQLDKPLPKTINEYKNHPLYVLKRHLLKFEAIYPPDSVTLGFVRGEAVYARECVHTLHSRELWVKHAKVVKPKQEPYKIVKARPKYDKLTGNTITDLPLEIFGKWQVADYVPPTAENGVVPRNAFGNVELFKACMLPKKTVHLQLPGLNKVARKLQIDCAPAVVGFDYHCGGSHPTFDGYIVCEEFKDTLIAAWEQEQVESARREQEKYDKRVYGNWRKLIKAVLICERLKVRYDFGKTADKVESKNKKGEKVAVKKRRICSDNESDSG